jgi:hypothetical protein
MGIRSAWCSFQTAIKTNHTAVQQEEAPGFIAPGLPLWFQR